MALHTSFTLAKNTGWVGERTDKRHFYHNCLYQLGIPSGHPSYEQLYGMLDEWNLAATENSTRTVGEWAAVLGVNEVFGPSSYRGGIRVDDLLSVKLLIENSKIMFSLWPTQTETQNPQATPSTNKDSARGGPARQHIPPTPISKDSVSDAREPPTPSHTSTSVQDSEYSTPGPKYKTFEELGSALHDLASRVDARTQKRLNNTYHQTPASTPVANPTATRSSIRKIASGTSMMASGAPVKSATVKHKRTLPKPPSRGSFRRVSSPEALLVEECLNELGKELDWSAQDSIGPRTLRSSHATMTPTRNGGRSSGTGIETAVVIDSDSASEWVPGDSSSEVDFDKEPHIKTPVKKRPLANYLATGIQTPPLKGRSTKDDFVKSAPGRCDASTGGITKHPIARDPATRLYASSCHGSSGASGLPPDDESTASDSDAKQNTVDAISVPSRKGAQPVDDDSTASASSDSDQNTAPAITQWKMGHWTPADTQVFYKALSKFGTDFLAVRGFCQDSTGVFLTRLDIERKFKQENRESPVRVQEHVQKGEAAVKKRAARRAEAVQAMGQRQRNKYKTGTATPTRQSSGTAPKTTTGPKSGGNFTGGDDEDPFVTTLTDGSRSSVRYRNEKRRESSASEDLHSVGSGKRQPSWQPSGSPENMPTAFDDTPRFDPHLLGIGGLGGAQVSLSPGKRQRGSSSSHGSPKRPRVASQENFLDDRVDQLFGHLSDGQNNEWLPSSLGAETQPISPLHVDNSE